MKYYISTYICMYIYVYKHLYVCVCIGSYKLIPNLPLGSSLAYENMLRIGWKQRYLDRGKIRVADQGWEYNSTFNKIWGGIEKILGQYFGVAERCISNWGTFWD